MSNVAPITQICASLAKTDVLIGAPEIRAAIAIALGVDKDTGRCDWKQKKLAAVAAMTVSRFSEACNNLVRANKLETRRRGKKLSNHYRLIVTDPVWIVVSAMMEKRCKALDLRVQIAAAKTRKSVATHDKTLLIFDMRLGVPAIMMADFLGITAKRVGASFDRLMDWGILSFGGMAIEHLGKGKTYWDRDVDLHGTHNENSRRFLLMRFGEPIGPTKDGPTTTDEALRLRKFGASHSTDSGQITPSIRGKSIVSSGVGVSSGEATSSWCRSPSGHAGGRVDWEGEEDRETESVARSKSIKATSLPSTSTEPEPDFLAKKLAHLRHSGMSVESIKGRDV